MSIKIFSRSNIKIVLHKIFRQLPLSAKLKEIIKKIYFQISLEAVYRRYFYWQRRIFFPHIPPIEWSLDVPSRNSVIEKKFNISGWCFCVGQPVREVLVLIDGKKYFCDIQQPRPDIGINFEDAKYGNNSGFILGVELDVGRHTIDLIVTLGDQKPNRLIKGRKFMVSSHTYVEWIRRYDSIDDAKRGAIKAAIDLFAYKPLISVVMPVYNPPIELLNEAIQSVTNQLYQNWELCIADDASPNPEIENVLRQHEARDPRIKVVYRKKNGHISAASNSALELVSGGYITLLDHDDLLAENALFYIAKTINNKPDVQLIYSDEDKIDRNGVRLDPYFKSDWNYDLFLSQNMFSHLGTYKTSLVRDVGGFRIGYEGSQDYDLALRCIEKLQSFEQIHHIPHILYHWRVLPGSTALNSSEKPYAMLAGERAINDHFARAGINAKSELIGYGYRVHYGIPENKPLVSLIIPTRNGYRLIKKCIKSILKKTSYKNYEILIVDNGSDEYKTIKYLKSFDSNPIVRVIKYDGPFNYSAINNHAVKESLGSIIGLINNDIEVISPDWLTEMVSLAIQKDIGAVGARLLYPDSTIQHGGVILGIAGLAGHAHKHMHNILYGYCGRGALCQTFSAVTAACLVVRKNIYEQVGGLDEKNLAVAYNDIDFCLKIKSTGLRNVWTPYAELYHHESATRGVEDTEEKRKRFKGEVEYMRMKWADIIDHDPAYNPNLTLEKEDFDLAWPPRTDCNADDVGMRNTRP